MKLKYLSAASLVLLVGCGKPAASDAAPAEEPAAEEAPAAEAPSVEAEAEADPQAVEGDEKPAQADQGEPVEG